MWTYLALAEPAEGMPLKELRLHGVVGEDVVRHCGVCDCLAGLERRSTGIREEDGEWENSQPGHNALTCTLYGAQSNAAVFVSPITPCFAAVYPTAPPRQPFLSQRVPSKEKDGGRKPS